MELSEQLSDLWYQAQQYFSQLNEQETYAWGAEGLGLVLVIVGIFLL